jgi:fatty acid desaturase
MTGERNPEAAPSRLGQVPTGALAVAVLVLIGIASGWLTWQVAVTIVLFVLILGVTVLVHELGHFVAARLAGVRVLEFGVGFPPRARVLRSKG